MSECIRNCSLCNKLVISQSVSFTNENLVINLPQRAYNDDCKYCVIIAQAIPDTATINAPVVFSIGTDTTTYPFVNNDCSQIVASQLRTRKIYPTRVSTSATSGVFKYIGSCLPSAGTITIESLPVPAITPQEEPTP